MEKCASDHTLSDFEDKEANQIPHDKDENLDISTLLLKNESLSAINKLFSTEPSNAHPDQLKVWRSQEPMSVEQIYKNASYFLTSEFPVEISSKSYVAYNGQTLEGKVHGLSRYVYGHSIFEGQFY